jgi:PII-like signaling protein
VSIPFLPTGPAKKVTILVTQPHGEHGNVHLKILERLRAEGASGATAFKAVAGFGAHHVVHSLRLAEVMPDLPYMIVWIDTPERVEQILPSIQGMIRRGLITVEDVQVTAHVRHE